MTHPLGAVAESDEPTNGDGAIHILHVDDATNFVELTREFLQQELDDVVFYAETTASDALDCMEESPIDCVVSDYQMPTTNGLSFLDTVRERYPDLPFILFTGKGSEEIASEAVSAGVTDYIQKTTDTEQYAVLANRIENAVERTRAQQAHDEMARRYATLISNLPGIVYRCKNEPDWPMEYVAGRCEDLFGYTATDLENGYVSVGRDLIDQEDRTRVWEETQAAVENREQYVIEYRITTKSGTTKWVQGRGKGVYRDGKLVALEGYLLDLTPQKRRERMLERHNEHLEEFARAVSHTLRNPLQVAVNAVEMLPDSWETEQVDRVERSLTRMEVLIEKLLTLVRRGQVVNDTVPVELTELASQAWRDVAPETATLEVETAATVEVDPPRMQEVLEHLFRNAIEYGGEDVTVTVGDLDDGFYVADDGPGIPDDHYDAVFQPGYSTRSDSTGFGLDIIRSIVEAHGWDISATESEDGGARFEIRRFELF
jgi:PAS domain S-box-containing protein